jgi:hypothetical protein
MSGIRKALLALAAFAAAGAANARSISVPLDGTKLVRVPGNAASVSIGNPMIAGVAIDSAKTVFITGRQWGKTNMFVLDAYGATIMSVPIEVASQNANTVVVYRGGAESGLSYNCANTCERAVSPGDDAASTRALVDVIDRRNNLAKQSMKNDGN